MIDYKNGETIEEKDDLGKAYGKYSEFMEGERCKNSDNYIYKLSEGGRKEIAEQKEKARKAADILFDPVSRPKHYAGQCSLECIEVLRLVFGEEETVHFCHGNVFKYLWRYKGKNGTEDLKKAKWYLDYARHMLDGSEYVSMMCNDKQKQLEEMYARIMGADYIWE